MHGLDRLTVVGPGVAIISTIAVGTCSTHAQLDDSEANLNEEFSHHVPGSDDLIAWFAEEAEQPRQEHRRTEERLDLLIDTLLRGCDPAAYFGGSRTPNHVSTQTGGSNVR